MAAPNLDRSLDEIISSKPRHPRRGSSHRGGGGAKRNIIGNSRPGSTQNSPRSSSNLPLEKAAPAGNKILISNLPPDVNEKDVMELFSTTVGSVRECQVNYDSQGRSKGTASVTFGRASDAASAFQQYNNRLIDGKRTLRIEIIFDPNRAPQPTLAQRVGEPRERREAQDTRMNDAHRPSRGSRGGRGRGRGGRRGDDRPTKTAEDLDAEMADYNAANEGDEAAAA